MCTAVQYAIVRTLVVFVASDEHKAHTALLAADEVPLQVVCSIVCPFILSCSPET